MCSNVWATLSTCSRPLTCGDGGGSSSMGRDEGGGGSRGAGGVSRALLLQSRHLARGESRCVHSGARGAVRTPRVARHQGSCAA